MILTYFDDELNFGDALNDLIFKYYIPELLEDNDNDELLGIGTLLGLKKPGINTKKIYIFSSGLGYGEIPTIDNRYEFICVRGPLTAALLNLPASYAISDGALLLKGMKFREFKKEFKWSYIPHWTDDTLYSGWPDLIKNAGGHFINPRNNPQFVINEILKSELILAEAMHGAIVADTLRVPWIGIKAYKHINAFKWQDWLLTVNLDYKPKRIHSFFDLHRTESSLIKRLPKCFRFSFFTKILPKIYFNYQENILKYITRRRLKSIAKSMGILSSTDILDLRYNQLKSKLDILKELKR